MSRAREVAGEWAAAHACCCKVFSVILICVALIFLSVGSVLVSQNGGSWDFDNESFDEASSKSA